LENANDAMIIATTERLILRAFELEDAPFIFEIMNTSSWIENIGNRNIHNTEDACNYLENKLIASYKEYDFGHYHLIRKEDNCSIGMCGLVKRPELEDVDLGFALLPKFERKGYAYEASLAVIKFAKTVLKLEQLCAVTIPSNIPSIRLLEKLGFQFEKEIDSSNDEILRLYNKKI